MDASCDSRGRILTELAEILVVTTAFLYVSESVFGGATLLGGALGWGGLMLGVLLVWLSLKRRGASWDSLGLGRPKSWVWTLLQGLGVAVGVMVVTQVVFQLLVFPLVGAPDSSRFAAIAGNPLKLVGGLFSVWTAAAFGEEILFRGYVVERLVRLHGDGRSAWIGAVLVQSVVFGLLHFYQGPSGIVITGIIGLLFGLAFLVVRRNLWVLILAHGLIDTVSFLLIYASA
jgi:hypothetical protein